MKTIQTFIFLLLTATLSACHDENDDYFAQNTIVINEGDGINISLIQATANITNINSRQTTSSTAFDGAELKIKLLRGIYQISIEGVVTYTDENNTQHDKSFRVISDYVDFSGKNKNVAFLDIIFLE